MTSCPATSWASASAVDDTFHLNASVPSAVRPEKTSLLFVAPIVDHGGHARRL